MKEDKEELEEIRGRQVNVIIHRLGELTEESVVQRRQVDDTSIENLLHDMNCDVVSVSAIIRLEKRQEGAESIKTIAGETDEAKIGSRRKDLNIDKRQDCNKKKASPIRGCD